jgi:hypothetical protein
VSGQLQDTPDKVHETVYKLPVLPIKCITGSWRRREGESIM